VSLLLAAALFLQEPTLDQLIDGLRADRVEDREAAAKALKLRAPSSIPLLNRASRDSDPEVAQRSQDILDLLGKETGPRDFEKLEEAFLGARTITVKMRGETSKMKGKAEDRSKVTATIILAGSNRVFMRQSEQDAQGAKYGFSLISDGSKMMKVLEYGDSRDARLMKVPKDLHQNLTAILVRDGSPGMMLGFLSGNRGTEEDFFLQNVYRFRDYKVVEWDDTAKVLTYGLSYRLEQRRVQGRISYDPKSYLPTRRTRHIECDVVGYGMTLIETNEEFTLNADIPDETFKLPEEKK
jgi:hypothetical protein